MPICHLVSPSFVPGEHEGTGFPVASPGLFQLLLLGQVERNALLQVLGLG